MRKTVAKITRLFVLLGMVVVLLIGGTLTAQAASKKVMTKAKAKTAVLKHAKVKKKAVKKWTKVKLDTEDGIKVYEVEFRTSTHKYDYEINAYSGKVLEYSKKKISAKSSSAKSVSSAKAEQYALKHAKVSKSKVKSIKTETERKKGNKIFEIKFTTSTHKYEYEISAKNGEILSYEKKRIKKSTSASGSSSSTDFIGAEKAKSIAAASAGITNPVNISVKLDRDDGRYVYEVELRDGNRIWMEYECEIDAITGKVLSAEWDD